MTSNAFQLPHRLSRTQQRSLSRDRKRKRGSHALVEDFQDVTNDQSPSSITASTSTVGITSLTANQAEQYRTAGLLPHEAVPSSPFPHTPANQPRPKRGQQPRAQIRYAHTEEGDAVGKTAEQTTSLRRQHLSVLTAMMHRCLLDGDYERAGKAWSLLIRSNPPLDVRRHDQWGIGAEILMRRPVPHAGDDSAHSDEDSDTSRSRGRPLDANTPYHEQGLRAARSYYDMLIRRFPAQLTRTAPRSLPNAIEFNPVMLNIWLYQVAFTRKKILQEIHDRAHRSDDTVDDDSSGTRSREGEDAQAREVSPEQLRVGELREAELILAKLNELFGSPAYDRDPHLRQLHGMVELWVEDLRSEGTDV